MAWIDERKFYCPMVKANAYGHSAPLIGAALSEMGVQRLGVALVEEGVELRTCGVTEPEIFCFGQHDEAAVTAILENRLTPVISSMEQLRMYAAAPAARRHPLDVHLKFNTGMNRLGLHWMSVPQVLETLRASPHLRPTGVCSHLACGEDMGLEHGFSATQVERFREIERFFPDTVQRHLFASASGVGFFLRRGFRLPYGLRPGITIYGIPPMKGTAELDTEVLRLGFEPVLELRSVLTQVNSLRVGDTVSYGGAWKAARPSQIGVVAAGYADGVSRALSNKGWVLYAGRRVPIVGRVCMDYFMIDLTDVPESLLALGGAVTLLGRDGDEVILAQEIADRLGTIPYEVVTSIGPRVPRVMGD
jgi:alanine racemase